MSKPHCEICKYNHVRSKTSKLCVNCADGVQRVVYATEANKAAKAQAARVGRSR